MLSKNSSYCALMLCTISGYTSIEKVLWIAKLGLNPLINPLISRCEKFKILPHNLPCCFLQLTIIQRQILFVEMPKIANPFLIPWLIPLHEFSKNSNLPQIPLFSTNMSKIKNLLESFWRKFPKTPFSNT